MCGEVPLEALAMVGYALEVKYKHRNMETLLNGAASPHLMSYTNMPISNLDHLVPQICYESTSWERLRGYEATRLLYHSSRALFEVTGTVLMHLLNGDTDGDRGKSIQRPSSLETLLVLSTVHQVRDHGANILLSFYGIRLHTALLLSTTLASTSCKYID